MYTCREKRSLLERIGNVPKIRKKIFFDLWEGSHVLKVLQLHSIVSFQVWICLILLWSVCSYRNIEIFVIVRCSTSQSPGKFYQIVPERSWWSSWPRYCIISLGLLFCIYLATFYILKVKCQSRRIRFLYSHNFYDNVFKFRFINSAIYNLNIR